MRLKCFQRIAGAAWLKPATSAQKRREHQFVDANEQNWQEIGDFPAPPKF
jgi:hypothetical protein